MHYVYKVTNKHNGKVYIGKRKHNNPINDSYMGSGKLIKLAIEKYGRESFTKEIIEIFNTDAEASLLEKTIVTLEFINSGNSYNMHEGGRGGFAHINNAPPEERINIKSLRKKIAAGEIKVGGTSNWTDESYLKVREQGWGARRARGELENINNWEGLTEEDYHQRCKKISDAVKGDRNGSYGTHIYVDPSTVELPPNLNKHRFKEGYQPEGWVTIIEWKDCKKDKTNNAYGRKWFNDGQVNYYLYPNDQKVFQNNLVLGRLKINNCCG